PGDLSHKSSAELTELLKNDNPWWYRTALRLLAERRDRSVAGLLENILLHDKNDTHVLRALWALYGMGAWEEANAARMLTHESPWVRAWTVRLLGESGQVSTEMMQRLTELAKHDPAAQVRLQLACSCQRLLFQDTVPLLQQLMLRLEDARDPCFP